MSDYIKNIRQLIGRRKFIHPAARIIIENEAGEVLFVCRKDTGRWGLPAGGLEENEDIETCIRREVKEETGLEVLELEVIGISSDPGQESVVYPNADQIQYFVIEFYSNQWQGNLRQDGEEVNDVRFLPVEKVQDLPANEWSTFESLVYFRANGRVRLR